MPWEHRRGSSNLYYTRTIRVGKDLIRVYFPLGPLAEFAALQDGMARIDKEIRRREREGLIPIPPPPGPCEPEEHSSQDGDAATAEVAQDERLFTGPETVDAEGGVEQSPVGQEETSLENESAVGQVASSGTGIGASRGPTPGAKKRHKRDVPKKENASSPADA
jgi:hypothetical protein